MIPMFLPCRLSLSLLPLELSGGEKHLPARQEHSLFLHRCDGWPGFWHKASQGQWGLFEQRHEDKIPASTKDTHQPQADACRIRLRGNQGRNVRDGTGWDGLFRFTPDAQQPQGGHGDGQPQTRGSLGFGHVGTLPLPAGAFGDLETLFNPGPQPIPTGGAGLRRQVRQNQPRIFVARFPARQQRAVELTMPGL